MMLRRCYVFTHNQDFKQSSKHCRCTEEYVPKESCELALRNASKEAAVAELMCQTMALEAMANIFIQLRPFIGYNWL